MLGLRASPLVPPRASPGYFFAPDGQKISHSCLPGAFSQPDLPNFHQGHQAKPSALLFASNQAHRQPLSSLSLLPFPPGPPRAPPLSLLSFPHPRTEKAAPRPARDAAQLAARTACSPLPSSLPLLPILKQVVEALNPPCLCLWLSAPTGVGRSRRAAAMPAATLDGTPPLVVLGMGDAATTARHGSAPPD